MYMYLFINCCIKRNKVQFKFYQVCDKRAKDKEIIIARSYSWKCLLGLLPIRAIIITYSYMGM